MKKILNILLLSLTLLLTSSCDTIAHAEYDGFVYSYNYFLYGNPVVVINGNYYWHKFVGETLMYCIIPEYYKRYIVYYPESRRYLHVRPHSIPHVYNHRRGYFNLGRKGIGSGFSTPPRPMTNHRNGHSRHRGGR